MGVSNARSEPKFIRRLKHSHYVNTGSLPSIKDRIVAKDSLPSIKDRI